MGRRTLLITAEIYGIKNKKRDFWPPSTWYGNLTLIVQGALFFKSCCFSSPHSWRERFKCHSNSLRAQKQTARMHWAARTRHGNLHSPLLHKSSLSSRHFTHHLLCFWANILILLLCEALRAAYLSTLDTQEGFVLCHFATFVWSKTSVESRWDTLPPRVGFLFQVIVSDKCQRKSCCLSMEQPPLILNYRRCLFGSPQTRLISISSSNCLSGLSGFAQMARSFTFFCFVMFSDPFQWFFPQKNCYMGSDFIVWQNHNTVYFMYYLYIIL